MTDISGLVALEAAPTDAEVEAMHRRAKQYGCDIRATHESLTLVGDLDFMLRSLSRQVAEWQAAWRGMHDRAERAEAALVEKDAEIRALIGES